MKRDFLKDLGLEAEIIDKIMAQYGADVEKLRATNDAQNENIKALNIELENKNNEMNNLISQNKELEDLKQRFAQIQEQKKQAEDKFNTDLRDLKIKNALDEVEATGYGIVMPTMNELKLEEPEIMKQGGRYGVRLKASAPSIHMMKANITTEVAPIVGTESRSEEMIMYLLREFEENPSKPAKYTFFSPAFANRRISIIPALSGSSKL